MARIFLSHSSANNAEAIVVRDWLIGHGWNDFFLDLDSERGLKAGERWQAALKQAAERCELVIFLVSPAWAQSRWCIAEFLLAKSLNKRVLGVIIEPTLLAELPAEMTAEWQMVDLTAGPREHRVTVNPPPGGMDVDVAFAKEGLERLRIGLAGAGLEPRYFAWPPEADPDRQPYRGLKPLEAGDAGIFFGRDGPIVIGLDQLRGLREGPAPRLLVILGASGAGKSSFMRAGLWPRLAREDQHFLPLPIMRPERAALTGETGLMAVLEDAFKGAGLARTRAEVRAAVKAGSAAVAPLLTDLTRAKARQTLKDGLENSKPPTVVLCIDQTEELFPAEAGDEAGAFLRLVRDLAVKDEPAIIALFTIRSDHYERLQTAKELEGVRQHALSLPPMPQGSYAEVIKGPADRLAGTKRALEIEEPLVDVLLSDIEAGGAKDALPLLAFTLERLYREHGGDGDLRLAEYEQLGRVKGSIEAAVEEAFKAADADTRLPKDRDARLTLLRRGLIPWLAGIDPDTGAPRRRVARLSEIPLEARPLIDLLIEQRLLSTDVAHDTGETTLEPAHEALLRQWGHLQGWLEEDFEALATLDGIKRAARDWAANANNPEWLAHLGGRLDAAKRLLVREDLARNLTNPEREYLTVCAETVDVAHKRELNRLRREQFSSLVGRTSFGALALIVLALVFAGQWIAPLIPGLPRIQDDWSRRFFRHQLPSQHPHIAIVAITDETLEGLKTRSPIDRALLARLVDAIDAAEPKAIGIDILSARNPPPDNDEMFIASIKNAKAKVVLPAADERVGLPRKAMDGQSKFLAEAGRPAGFINLATERDWVVRYEARPIPGGAWPKSFAELLAEAALQQKSEARWGRIVWLEDPLDGSDAMMTVRAELLLKPEADPMQKAARRALEGKIVLIGAMFPDIDRHFTPRSQTTDELVPGVTIHAQILAQRLDGVFLYPVGSPVWLSLPLCVVAFALGVICAGRVVYLLAVPVLVFLSVYAHVILFRFNIEASILLIPICFLSLLAGIIYGRLRLARNSQTA